MIPVLLLSATLGCAAWLYGGTEPWAWHMCQALAALCLAAVLLESRRRREDDPEAGEAPWSWSWGLPAVLLMAFMAVQAANPSHAYSPGDEGLTPLQHIPWLPHSVSRAASVQAIGRLVTCLVVMLTARYACASRGASQGLVALLLTSGTTMAVLVILQRADHPRPPYAMTGMFVNGSNYAAYANLLLPMALSLGRASQMRARRRGDRSHPGHLLYLAAAILVVSVLISGSRAGVAVSLSIAAGWAGLEALEGVRRGRSLAGAAVLLLPMAIAVGVFLALRADRMGTAPLPFEEGMFGMSGRLAALRGSVRLFLDRWFAGCGAGTFACAFPYYQPSSIAGLYFRYAHNDWIEYGVELGLAGSGLLAWFLAAVLWPWAHATVGVGFPNAAPRGGGRVRRTSTWRRYERRGIGLALAGMAAHALVDFPVHIPAILLTACVLAGLWNRRPAQ